MNTKDMVIRNAVISGASLEIERGMLTGFVYLEDGMGGCQGFGGYDLTHGNNAGYFIKRVLEIAEVEEWKKLKGCPVRFRSKPWGTIDALGHFLKDEWFDINEEFEAILYHQKKDRSDEQEDSQT